MRPGSPGASPSSACWSGAGRGASASPRTCTATSTTSSASSRASIGWAPAPGPRWPPASPLPPPSRDKGRAGGRAPGQSADFPSVAPPACWGRHPESRGGRDMEALLSLSNELAGAVERIAPSIVAVHARRRLPSTGIHWRPGIVVTAEHTVRAEDGLTVETPDGRSHPATLVGRDPGTDLAVLKITTDLDGPPAPRGDDGALRVGHMVLALGYGPRAGWGVISALGPRWRTWRGGEIDRLVRLDLVLYPGFSGGPLVDAAGHVVGVNTSALARDSRLAVPVTTVGRVVDELLRQGHVSRGYLGI